jgi:hypothetical protein
MIFLSRLRVGMSRPHHPASPSRLKTETGAPRFWSGAVLFFYRRSSGTDGEKEKDERRTTIDERR